MKLVYIHVSMQKTRGDNTTRTTSGSLNLQRKRDSGARHKHTAGAHRNNSVYMQSTIKVSQRNSTKTPATEESGSNSKSKACWPSQL
jgi:hypothetical protein